MNMPPLRASILVALLIAGVSATPSLHATPGDLDLTFNVTGKVVTPIGPGYDSAQSVAVQSDGKIVVAGFANNGSNHDFALVRYTDSGALDTSFGSGGKVTTAIGSGDDYGQSVAMQSDGKIVVAGRARIGSNQDFALVRYMVGGALDTSFGTGGKVTTAIGSGNDSGYSVVVQSDGKIVVAGDSGGNIALVRYTDTGALDASFGIGGKVTTDMIGGSFDNGYSVVLQSDGKIVVAGSSTSDIALVRYTDSGALDTSFGIGGKVITDIGGSSDVGNSVAMQCDGKIVVAGLSVNPVGFDFDIAVVRYTDSGALDTSFGSGGKVTTDLGSGYDVGNSVAVQSNGKIVVAGTTSTDNYDDFALVCYTESGALDASFGTGGKVTTNIGNRHDRGISIALQSDGHIVVAGDTLNTASNLNDFAVVRYLGEPIIVPTVTLNTANLAINASTLTITGTNFDAATPANNTVAFTPAGSGTVTASTATSLTVTGISGLSLGTLNAVVTTNGEDSCAAVQVANVTTAMSIPQAWAAGYGVSSDLNVLGTNGLANLLNFAFGLDPTGIVRPELIYTGTLVGGGTVTGYGLPITAFEPDGDGSMNYRALFVRRKDYAAAGLVYTPSFSADLSVWQDNSAPPIILADDESYQVVSVPYPASIGGKPGRFFIIRVNLVP